MREQFYAWLAGAQHAGWQAGSWEQFQPWLKDGGFELEEEGVEPPRSGWRAGQLPALEIQAWSRFCGSLLDEELPSAGVGALRGLAGGGGG